MSPTVIIAIVIILVLVAAGAYMVMKTPAGSGTSIPQPPFAVGDLVEYELKITDNATDLCGPSPDGTNNLKAVGTIMINADNTIGVRWDHVWNTQPRAGLTTSQCNWFRSVGEGANESWNMKYWGNETTNPTYVSGLKSVFTWDEARASLAIAAV